MRILLTGGSGFIGSAFLRHAAAAGHELVAVARDPCKLPRISGERVSCVPGDLARMPWSDLSRFQFDCLVHAAWITTPGIYWEAPENESYLKWSESLVDESFRRGIDHAMILGSCAEYGVSESPLHPTDSPIQPRGLYGRCKNDLRGFVEAAARDAGGSACWARLFYPYGPGEPAGKLCSHAAASFQRGEKLNLATPTDRKDFIYVDDVASAMLTLLEARMNGACNIGVGEAVRVSDLVRMIAAELGRPELAPDNPTGGERRGSGEVANIDQLLHLKWAPQTSLKSGIKKLIASISPQS
jgi:nucleoside-diphosphate-sugar epimerase